VETLTIVFLGALQVLVWISLIVFYVMMAVKLAMLHNVHLIVGMEPTLMMQTVWNVLKDAKCVMIPFATFVKNIIF